MLDGIATQQGDLKTTLPKLREPVQLISSDDTNIRQRNTELAKEVTTTDKAWVDWRLDVLMASFNYSGPRVLNSGRAYTVSHPIQRVIINTLKQLGESCLVYFWQASPSLHYTW